MQQDLPFNERGITLSRAGLSASGQLFPLRDLRGVTVVMVPRQKPLPITLSVIGVLVAAVEVSASRSSATTRATGRPGG